MNNKYGRLSPEISKEEPVRTPVTPKVPAIVALTSTSSVSICAVPSIKRSLNSNNMYWKYRS